MTTHEAPRPSFFESARSTVRDLGAAAAEVPRVAADVRHLLQGDVQLGVAEMRETAVRAGGASAIAAAAGVLAVIGVVFAWLTVMFALATAVDLWLAALITTLLIFLVAFIAYRVAMARFKTVHPAPSRAADSLGKDISWLKALLRSNGT
jgi:hypothetical protein